MPSWCTVRAKSCSSLSSSSNADTKTHFYAFSRGNVALVRFVRIRIAEHFYNLFGLLL